MAFGGSASCITDSPDAALFSDNACWTRARHAGELAELSDSDSEIGGDVAGRKEKQLKTLIEILWSGNGRRFLGSKEDRKKTEEEKN